MKLSVSAYRAHASAHKKILATSQQLNYGSTSASHPHPVPSGPSGGSSTGSTFQIDPPSSGGGVTAGRGGGQHGNNAVGGGSGSHLMVTNTAADEGSSDDANTPLQSPKSQNTSREEDDSSNANESDCKSPSQRTKSNQRWMKLRTTVQISSAISAKKPPLKREDSFLQRFSTRQIPETQETVEDTGSEGGTTGDNYAAPRRRRRYRKQPKSVVNPDSNFYFYWLLVLTVCVLYNLWTLIVRESFPELQAMISTFWLTCDSMSDLVFLLDLAVQLRTGYLEQGLMVYDSKKLACHYLRSRAFLLDLAALCPLDLLQFRLGWHPMLRCPRFLKVYRAVNYYYMVESRTVWPNLWRVINLIHILLILAHWFGCFYFLLSEAEGFRGDWVYPYRPGDYATLTRKYLGSLYWSTLTLTTIGDLPTPETNAEYIFTIVSYLIGVFIFATIVGQVGNVITNRNANRLEFERLLDGAKTYMRHHKVPGGMKRRVLRWYDYSWSRGRIQGGGDINTALGLLPDKLKTELALHVNLSVLKKVTIFQECQPEFLRDLVLKMKAYIFTPGDSICRKGEVAREMFIIADGILEVLSEHGKVLTTMKAGDFFGEIGILNLDGLNKRTADVRSVGYSELFSLSREDVLNAMKDYPEAQEILQALGRKRLMEVKASARHPPHKEHHHHHHHTVDGKGLVDKIKSEAKGLRNVLKKSRTHRRSQESLELKPLHTSSNNNNKATLKRMSRVKSHDLSQDEADKKETCASEPFMSPIGAGLPLLQRLKLLKEKQDNEERVKDTSPPILSPTSSTIRSPPPITEESTEEMIGAGLPLLQRILMLKAKEEKAAKAARTGVGGTKSVTGQLFSGISLSKGQPQTPTPQMNTLAPRLSSSGPSKSPLLLVAKSAAPAKLLNNKISFRDRIKLATSAKEKDSSIKDSLLKDSDPPSITDTTVKLVPFSPSSDNNQLPLASGPINKAIQTLRVSASDNTSDNNNTNSKSSLDSGDSVDKNEPHWLKLKRAAISKDLDACSLTPSKDSIDDGRGKETIEDSAKNERTKPSLVLTKRTKHYRSIDDLSPEYGPLPFVKKLKILNERQKLEELELVMKTRSFSLDIPENQSVDSETLTRSHSEGSTMHQDRNFLSTPLMSSPLHSSNESNETLERRNLKSILKKLSEDIKDKDIKETTATMPEKLDSTEFRRLMRAPTIEGYAARHSKLSKSVTFNRNTLQSPPSSATIKESPQSLFEFGNSTTDNALEDMQEQEEHTRDLNRCENQIVTNKTNHQVKLIKGSLDDEQQYFADILMAIKQVMSSHLHDIQEKYQQKFEKLEEEMKAKDAIITQLKAHICELEQTGEDSFTLSDSLDTVISRDKQSWEEPSNDEQEELEDLPRPIHAWSPPPHNVVLDIDSTTDTESDVGETSETEQIDFDPVEYENSSNNWEIELLAAQMRDRRSASLDHSAGRPLRKRFVKGSSMDHE
ncbi:cyclic nucleotide-gated ion channel-like isoform X3 [Leptinotarsa decemlineata]|uniref:cyclic nucleotide-gated ion channel-like isoform X3 n=1 Tax=Leptinotarsa decemlineata TaxID=7539 RepID=UPI003D308AC0